MYLRGAQCIFINIVVSSYMHPLSQVSGPWDKALFSQGTVWLKSHVDSRQPISCGPAQNCVVQEVNLLTRSDRGGISFVLATQFHFL